MSAHDFRTIAFLQYLLVRSWLRRAIRSPLFWIVAVALGFVIVSIVASAIGGGPGNDLSGWLDSGYFEAGSATFLTVAILLGVWRGSSAAPRASLADIVMLIGSPVSSRGHYAYLMIRDCAQSGLVLPLWFMVGFGGILVQTGDAWLPLRMLFLVFTGVVLSELLRLALWVSTEQVVARDPRRGNWLRRAGRVAVLLLVGILAGYLLPPVLDGSVDGWQDGLETLATRAGEVAVLPPMSWAVSVVTGGGSPLLSAVGLLLLPTTIAAFALLCARSFVEPISVNAERVTDARGKLTEPGADVQWAAMAQFGVSPRAKVSLRPFGRGPSAILWASLVRWVRYQVAASWIGLVMLGGFGVIMALAIRLEFAPVYAGWALVLLMPLFGSANAFMDELRKQFLYLTPGPAWKRLLAGAVTSVIDGLVASLMVIVALVLLGAVSVAGAVGLTMFTAALSVVSQSAVALVQVVLPYWIPQRIRIGITMGAAGLGAIPAVAVMVAMYVGTSVLPAMLTGSIVALACGASMLALAALFFDRMEFSG